MAIEIWVGTACTGPYCHGSFLATIVRPVASTRVNIKQCESHCIAARHKRAKGGYWQVSRSATEVRYNVRNNGLLLQAGRLVLSPAAHSQSVLP